MIISGKECCNEDKDCDNHELVCSGGYCVSACDLVSCRQNENCLAKDHHANCTCTNGYILDPANSGCYRGKTIQCTNTPMGCGGETGLQGTLQIPIRLQLTKVIPL